MVVLQVNCTAHASLRKLWSNYIFKVYFILELEKNGFYESNGEI